jgi:hypothetical protein
MTEKSAFLGARPGAGPPQVGLRLPNDVALWLKRRGAENLRSLAAEVALLVRAEMAREAKAKKRKARRHED